MSMNIVTDEFCNTFKTKFKKADKRKKLWSIDNDFPISFGTLIIYFNGPCKNIEIYINGERDSIDTLNPGETFTRTFSNLKSVEIFGYGNDGICCGCIGIINHYKKKELETTMDYFLILILFILIIIILCCCKNKIN